MKKLWAGLLALGWTAGSTWMGGLGLAGSAWAQQPAAAGAAPGASDARAVELLRASAEAVSRAGMMSFEGASYAKGAMEKGTPRREARVALMKAEAGGWKVLAVGTAEGAGKKQSLHVGYDGATARSIDEGEKTVFEQTTADWGEVRMFFASRGAESLVPWIMASEKPMEFGARGALIDGTGEADGQACQIVRVSAGGAGDAEPSSVRVYIAEADKLPRRIELIAGESAKGASGGGARVLELNGLKVGSAATPAAFTIAAPDGYRVKPVGGKEPEKKEKPRQQNPRGLLATGSAAPDFSLKDPKGKAWTLADYKGKVLVIDFWGSWCPPCRAAMPDIQKIHEKYQGKPVAVVGFNYERQKAADPAKFMKEKGFDYQLLLGAEKVAPNFKVPGWPTFYVVSPDGRILWGDVGHSPDHRKQMEKVIDEALKEMGRN